MMNKQAEIKEWARQLAIRFKPEKIILFGSYAYGDPTTDSDVDLLVELPNAKGGLQDVCQIVRKLKPGFPVDMIVHTPRQVRARIEQGDFFLRNIIKKVNFCMNAIVKEWVVKAEGDATCMEREWRAQKNPVYDAVCFHAQQCAENT